MPTKKKAEKEKHTALKAGGIFQTRANATAHRKHKNDQHELKLHFSQATHKHTKKWTGWQKRDLWWTLNCRKGEPRNRIRAPPLRPKYAPGDNH